MENKQMKCIKGKSCLYCGSNYCQFVEQLDQLKADLQDYQEWFDEFKVMFRYDDREPDDNSELYSCLESVVDENKNLKQQLAGVKGLLTTAHKEIEVLKKLPSANG